MIYELLTYSKKIIKIKLKIRCNLTAEVMKETPPSQAFQEELDKTQTVGSEAISDPMEIEKGLQLIQGMVEKPPALEADKVMDMEEFIELSF